MKLIYIGRVFKGGATTDAENPRMWTVVLPGHLRHLSTLCLGSLIELGLIKPPVR